MAITARATRVMGEIEHHRRVPRPVAGQQVGGLEEIRAFVAAARRESPGARNSSRMAWTSRCRAIETPFQAA
jgi:hypothetical protein